MSMMRELEFLSLSHSTLPKIITRGIYIYQNRSRYLESLRVILGEINSFLTPYLQIRFEINKKKRTI